MRTSHAVVTSVLFGVVVVGARASEPQGKSKLSTLPEAAQSGISAAIGQDNHSYYAEPRGNVLEAVNPRNKLSEQFAPDGVEVRTGHARCKMSARSYGYAGHFQVASMSTPAASRNRVEYRRGALTEWYVNGPAGLEQGFTVGNPPPQSGGPLTISLALSGDLNAVVEGKTKVSFVDQQGITRLRYSELTAFDSTGRELAAWDEVRAGELLLKVDDAGARYPVTIDPMLQLAELTPTDRANNDWFGISIAVSGNTVVVGDFDANIEQFGSAYVFVKPGSGWGNMTQTAKLTSSDSGAGFGTSVAISNKTIVVGAANTSNFDSPAATPGAAYVFVRPAGGWQDATETAKLTASDGQPGDAFGNSVSISQGTIAVGAFFVSNFSGRAYVFVRPSGGWTGSLTQSAELSASDSGGILDYLGCSVSTSGNTVVAGSFGHNNFQGAAYVYAKPAGGWGDMTETAELMASNGKSGNNFGFSVGISGGTIVAGAVGTGQGMGSAYVYVEPGSGWATTSAFDAQLGVRRGVQSGGFGQSVSISGNTVAVGSAGVIVGQNQNQGGVFLYVRPGSTWKTTAQPNAELVASDGAANDDLGVAVAISGSTVVAGAPKSGNPGEAYVWGP